jgi:glyoxylase-like metal-dependent hydrolase (beta-lactamase superfamily II)
MILERSMNDQFLSNTYLVADREGGSAAFIDAGGPMEPLFDAVERHNLTPTHLLLTHHHYDHVSEIPAVLERWPDIPVLIHPLERDQVEQATGTIEPGDTIAVGDLAVKALHTPGHTAGMISFLVEGNVFTGDTLFKNSVGGVRAPGHTTFADIKGSIMDTLMGLDHATEIRPGHTDATTVGDEWETNSFIRVWRGLDPEGEEPCTALGDPATLVLLGDDYDGGHKAWVRWPDGSDDIVPGSKVERG